MATDKPNYIASLPLYISKVLQNKAKSHFFEFTVESPPFNEKSTFILPMETLSNCPKELFKELARRGVPVTTRSKKQQVLDVIQSHEIGTPEPLLSDVGWTGGDFVTPKKIYPSESEDKVIFLGGNYDAQKWHARGSLEKWKKHVASKCKGNHIATFTLCVAFVPPLLKMLKSEGFGFLLTGKSSVGKTTLALVAGSVWGGDPSHEMGFCESYLSTHEGLETIALAHRDQLLILDETSLGGRSVQDIGKLLADSIMRLSSGSEKMRYTNADRRRSSRLAYIGTSNHSIRKIFARAGIPFDASYGVRLIEIPADTGLYGAFDRLPSKYPDGSSFSNALKSKSKKYYGTAIDSFLEQLTQWRAEDKADLNKWLKTERHTFRCKLNTDENDGIEIRVTEKFEIVYAAGRLAAEFGILPMCESEIADAVQFAYRASRKFYNETAATHDPVEVVRKYISENKFKFIDLREGLPFLSDREFRTSKGFIRISKKGGTEYLIHQYCFEKLIGKIGSLKLSYRELSERGFLTHEQGKSPKNTVKREVRNGKRDRVVCINGSILKN